MRLANRRLLKVVATVSPPVGLSKLRAKVQISRPDRISLGQFKVQTWWRTLPGMSVAVQQKHSNFNRT
jgi:hypothetical protein